MTEVVINDRFKYSAVNRSCASGRLFGGEEDSKQQTSQDNPAYSIKDNAGTDSA
jgi:hypothetical protein